MLASNNLNSYVQRSPANANYANLVPFCYIVRFNHVILLLSASLFFLFHNPTNFISMLEHRKTFSLASLVSTRKSYNLYV